MHMADALLSPAVGGAMCAVSAAAIGFSASKLNKDDITEKKIPLMAVAGAFVFAAQMVNFTIPGTGSSGHIGGGVLLAALLGGFPALLAIAAVLIIQCLFFADGGLLALGCNIFNMGVIPCLIVHPLLFKPLTKTLSARRLTGASLAAAVVGLQLGAFAVVLETQASGISALPFGAFALLMQPIHLAIGLVEGAITAAVLCFVYRARPEILQSAHARQPLAKAASLRTVVVALAVAAVAVGGALSLFASAYPDGLEWATEKAALAEIEPEGQVLAGAAAVQAATAFMPDYGFKATEEASAAGTSAAGLVGGALVFLLVSGAALLISAIKKRAKRRQAA